MNSTKPWYASKGILGSLTALGGAFLLILSMLGIIDAEQAEAGRAALPEAIGAVLTAVGGICAFWGRLKATKTIASMLLLFAVAPGLVGCVITTEDVSRVVKSERPVGSAIETLGKRDAYRDALYLWNVLAPEGKTIKVEDELLTAAAIASEALGGMIPIGSAVYVSQHARACATLRLSESTSKAAGCL